MSVRERLAAMTADDVLADLRAGTLDPILARPAGGAAAAWLDTELERLVSLWPAWHPDALTGLEARALTAIAATADANGRSEVQRTELARSCRALGRELHDAISWLRWRGSVASTRTSTPGADRVDRIQLRHWPRT